MQVSVPSKARIARNALLTLTLLSCFGCGSFGNAHQRRLTKQLAQLESERGWHILTYEAEAISYYENARRSPILLYSGHANPQSDWIGPASLSPGGESITFAEQADAGPFSLVVYDLGKKRREVVLKMPYIFWPRWSPRGDLIAFQCRTIDHGDYSLCTWRIPDKQVSTVLEGLPGGEGSFSWSPNGSEIVYQSTTGGIWILDLESKKRTWVDRGFSPTWSPNGRYIAYQHDVGSRWVVNDLRTGQKELLLAGEDVIGNLVWSPDSNYLVYAKLSQGFWDRLTDLRFIAQTYGDLWAMDAESKIKVKLYSAGQSIHPTDWGVIHLSDACTQGAGVVPQRQQ